jgi:VCBS repeat-containing protein
MTALRFRAAFVIGLTICAVAATPLAAQASVPGTVVAWGCEGFEHWQCSVPGGLSGVTAVSAGSAHSLALKADGTVVAWGCDAYYDAGQCSVPSGLSGVTAIAAGSFHSLALKTDGTVVAWGCGGAVNVGHYGQCSVPSGLAGVTAVAAGSNVSLALRGDGTVVAWGCGFGSLDAGQCSVPSGLAGVTAIAAGFFHSLALKADGTVVAWGCGIGAECSVPSGLSGVAAIAAGLDQSLAVKGDGTVVAWGCARLNAGQCSVPSGLSGVTAVAAGNGHSLALKSDGTVVAWGCAGYGVAQCNVPSGLSGVTAITAGTAHSLALVTNHAPVGTNDVYGTIQGNQLSVPAAGGVLVNDTDPDSGTTLMAVPVSGPSHGTLTLNADGSFTYTPIGIFSGSDSFTYRAGDGSLTSNVVTVTLTVSSTALFIDTLTSVTAITRGQQSSLKNKLAAAATFFSSGKLGPACGKLDAFIRQVNGLAPVKLSPPIAAVLINSANALKPAYGCLG